MIGGPWREWMSRLELAHDPLAQGREQQRRARRSAPHAQQGRQNRPVHGLLPPGRRLRHLHQLALRVDPDLPTS